MYQEELTTLLTQEQIDFFVRFPKMGDFFEKTVECLKKMAIAEPCIKKGIEDKLPPEYRDAVKRMKRILKV